MTSTERLMPGKGHEEDIDDEDSCNMTAVDPTSMLKSEDNDEAQGNTTDTKASRLHACVQTIRKKHSGKFDTLLNMIKSDRARFAHIMKQYSNSNNRFNSALLSNINIQTLNS